MPAYNNSPVARRGTTPYGLVPGNLEAPDPYADLGALYPNLSGTDSQASANIMAHLRGELTPETRAAIQDDAARYGVTSGMPGSDLSFRRGIVRSAGAREALQSQGLNEFGATSGQIRQNQILDPTLRATIAAHNADLNAAPDPEMNIGAIQNLFNRNRVVPGAGRGGSVTYGGGGGTRGPLAIPRLPQEFQEPDYSFHGDTHGTLPQDRAYNPALPAGFTTPGGGSATGAPLDWTGGRGVNTGQEFGPWGGFSEAEPSIGYDPQNNYGQNFSIPVDYGTQFQNMVGGTNPDAGNYDPNANYDYGQQPDYGTQAWY